MQLQRTLETSGSIVQLWYVCICCCLSSELDVQAAASMSYLHQLSRSFATSLQCSSQANTAACFVWFAFVFKCISVLYFRAFGGGSPFSYNKPGHRSTSMLLPFAGGMMAGTALYSLTSNSKAYCNGFGVQCE